MMWIKVKQITIDDKSGKDIAIDRSICLSIYHTMSLLFPFLRVLWRMPILYFQTFWGCDHMLGQPNIYPLLWFYNLIITIDINLGILLQILIYDGSSNPLFSPKLRIISDQENSRYYIMSIIEGRSMIYATIQPDPIIFGIFTIL